MVRYSTFDVPNSISMIIWEGSLKSVQGHEFTGTIEESGSEVKNFKKGDQVVSPFTVSWSARHHFNRISSMTEKMSVANAIIASMDSLQDVPRVCFLEQQLLMGPKPNMFAYRLPMPLQ